MPPSLAISSFKSPYTILCRAGCIFFWKAFDVMTTRKCVYHTLATYFYFYSQSLRTSFDVLPAIALWCECRCESLYISSVLGFRASVTFDRIASSIGVFDAIVAYNRRAGARSNAYLNIYD
jgi:hypothetical protein